MTISFTAQQHAFRAEVSAFIDQSLPADLRAKGLAGHPWAREDHVRWQRILNARGWGAPGWPVAHGGTGWSPVERFLFDTECAAACAPREIPFGLNMVAPVIMRYGTEHQKSRFLPKILSLDHWWAQGYSEPGAGSDLASLRTSAVRQGDTYVVNGQKIWTTLAHHANWIFCLVRTSCEGKQQAGISFLLIPLDTPGISVRPIHTIDGEHELNEVWFEEVVVPAENLIGEENQGWTYAKYLLKHERTDIARVGRAQAALAQLKHAVRRLPANGGGALIADPRFRDRLAMVEIRLTALEVMNMRLLASDADAADAGVQASVLKVAGSELHQSLSELTMRALGSYAARDPRPADGAPRTFEPVAEWHRSFDDTFTPTYLNMRKTTIYGGSTEVQKNILAQALAL
jgi:alkylation response protein AidB-like acyl-CoA dehydrogenase